MKFSVSGIAASGFGVLASIGGGASLYTTVVWLRTGKWLDFPLMDILIKFKGVNEQSAFYQWFYHPQSWLGLHAVAENIFKYPMYLVLIGMVLLWVAGMFGDWWD